MKYAVTHIAAYEFDLDMDEDRAHEFISDTLGSFYRASPKGEWESQSDDVTIERIEE